MQMDDEDLFRPVRENLFTAVIGDVTEAAGLMRQSMLQTIWVLQPDMMAAGRAMTVLEADRAGEHVGHSSNPEPFGLISTRGMTTEAISAEAGIM